MKAAIPAKPSFDDLYSVPDAQMSESVEDARNMNIILIAGVILVAGLAAYYAYNYNSIKGKLKIRGYPYRE